MRWPRGAPMGSTPGGSRRVRALHVRDRHQHRRSPLRHRGGRGRPAGFRGQAGGRRASAGCGLALHRGDLCWWHEGRRRPHAFAPPWSGFPAPRPLPPSPPPPPPPRRWADTPWHRPYGRGARRPELTGVGLSPPSHAHHRRPAFRSPGRRGQQGPPLNSHHTPPTRRRLIRPVAMVNAAAVTGSCLLQARTPGRDDEPRRSRGRVARTVRTAYGRHVGHRPLKSGAAATEQGRLVLTPADFRGLRAPAAGTALLAGAPL